MGNGIIPLADMAFVRNLQALSLYEAPVFLFLR
jgi:hypothetical protein